MSFVRAVSDLLRIHVLPHLGGDHRAARLAYIDGYRFPEGARASFAAAHPELDDAAQARVFDALKSFFAVHAVAPGSMAGMPSRIVEDAWRAFSDCTGDYARFCQRALGCYLAPAESPASDEALARTWAVACARERIEPKRPSRLPTLFAIDRELRVPNGRYYALNDVDSQMALRMLGASALIVLAAGLGSAAAGRPGEWDGLIGGEALADAVPYAGGVEMAGGDLGGGGGVSGDG